MIGEASTSPTTNPSLNTIIRGSVGLVTISLPPVRYFAIGALRTVTSWNRSTAQSPIANPITTAASDRRMRRRSSSR